MNKPSMRMIELLSLLQGGRAWPAADLANRLGTTPRTLRRDLDRLRELGYPVESTRGPGGSYRLVAGRAMPPLVLTDEEAIAAVVGLRFAAQLLTDDAADGALRKLEQVLPPRLRRRMEALSASTHAVTRARLDPKVVEALGTAAHEHHEVRFRYTDRTARESTRHVEPYRQVLLDRRWYLLAWDLTRNDWRTFRTDRITSVEPLTSTFAPREPLPDTMVHRATLDMAGAPGSLAAARGRKDSTADASTAPTDRSGAARRERGVVRFAAPVAEVSVRLVAEAGSLEPIDAHHCRYVSPPDDWEWLAITLAMVGVPYTVEAPPALIRHTRQLAARIAAAAEPPPR